MLETGWPNKIKNKTGFSLSETQIGKK